MLSNIKTSTNVVITWEEEELIFFLLAPNEMTKVKRGVVNWDAPQMIISVLQYQLRGTL